MPHHYQGFYFAKSYRFGGSKARAVTLSTAVRSLFFLRASKERRHTSQIRRKLLFLRIWTLQFLCPYNILEWRQCIRFRLNLKAEHGLLFSRGYSDCKSLSYQIFHQIHTNHQQSSYLPGCLVLHSSLRRHGSKYPLVVLVCTLSKDTENPDPLPAKAREVLKAQGLTLREIAWLEPVNGRYDGPDSRFVDTWTKLRFAELVEYEVRMLLDLVYSCVLTNI